MNLKTTLGALRLASLLEGISFLSFIITMPLKYIYEIKEPNYFVGMAHGILFIAYIFLVYWVSTERKWTIQQKFFAYIASLLPFGTFVADARIFKPTQLNEINE